jgi:hypothetical protein
MKSQAEKIILSPVEQVAALLPAEFPITEAWDNYTDLYDRLDGMKDIVRKLIRHEEERDVLSQDEITGIFSAYRIAGAVKTELEERVVSHYVDVIQRLKPSDFEESV